MGVRIFPRKLGARERVDLAQFTYPFLLGFINLEYIP